MRFGTVCSGISAESAAWVPLGWAPIFFAETATFPSRVLAHHYPSVANVGDFTRLIDEAPPAVDILAGGTPCQDFSCAGLREGLAGDRGNLALQFFRLAHRARPAWILWENVPGVLSSGGGRDFGAILGAMAELGYGWAYRVLDAQYFGVPQRRRRVFLVGRLGDWRAAAAVLFEREGLRRNPPPRREAGSEVAGTLGAGAPGSGWRNDLDRSGAFIAETAQTLKASARKSTDRENLVAKALTAHGARQDPTAETFICFDLAQIASPENRARPEPGKPAPTLAVTAQAAVAFEICQDPVSGAVSPALSKGGRAGKGVMSGTVVRRMTPREWERLQGFPDDYTAIEGASDSARYGALGNSIAVPVLAWIGRRIEAVERLKFRDMAEERTG